MQIYSSDKFATSSVRVGDRVRVRKQPWLVVAAEPHAGHQLFTLAGIGGANANLIRRVFTPFDHIESLDRTRQLRLTGMRGWRRLFVQALIQHGPWNTLKAALSAHIELLPHQLEPTLALVQGRGSRILLSDDVGLGKTIQAGLVIAELTARAAAERILILSPAGLRDQWQSELTSRFHLEPAIVDAADLRRRTASLPVGLNPWSTIPIVIASTDFIKRPEVLPGLLTSRWDVLVVDEAHGVTAGSDRRAAVHALAERTAYILLLTATPHNGDREAFVSLCDLGARQDPLLVFRRRRDEVSLGSRRRIHRLLVRPSPEEAEMHALLAAFMRAVRIDRAAGPGSSSFAGDAWLALNILQKRAFSSPHALAESLARRLAFLSPETADHPYHQLFLPLDEDGDRDRADEPPALRTVLLDDIDRERHLLTSLLNAARAAVATDTKRSRLADLVTRLNRRHEPAIIFTEYRDTLLHLEEHVPGTHAVLHGGLDRAARLSAITSFIDGRRSLLLATDAAGEGLNLQSNCRVVIHLELPWNPMRLEQRIGRVDRIGQRRTVHSFYLVARDTGEGHILRRLRERVARASADISAPDPLSCNADDPLMRPGTDVTSLRLRSEAAGEYQRLKHLRLLTTNSPANFPATDHHIVRATHVRRHKIRSLIGVNALLILQVTAEDSCGRVIATHLTPLLQTRTTNTVTREHIRGWLKASDSLQPEHLASVDPSLRNWSAATLPSYAAFWSTRINRERAIAADQRPARAALFQSGLFDQRELRRHSANRCADADVERDVAGRLAALEAHLSAPAVRIRPLLVLVPRY